EAVGGHGVDVGEMPTPALYFATHVLNVDGGVQVTGSHNPPEFNGFKIVLGGEAVAGPEVQGLRGLIEEGRTPGRPGGGRSEDGAVVPRYRDAIGQRNGPLPRKVKVVVDCGNGVSSLIAVDTLQRLGADVVPLFCESDGTFPNHHPDPSDLENLRDLQAAVRREGAELGIAFDGDGDRIGAVDDRGRPVLGDQLLVLLGRDLARRMGPGHAVIFDVKCSEVLPRELARAGLVPTMWKTGHSLIKQKMKETRAPLAGEMSGHMFFGGDWYGFDDALFAAARLLRYVADQGGPLSRLLADLPVTVATPELRVDCADDRKFEIVQRAAGHCSSESDCWSRCSWAGAGSPWRRPSAPGGRACRAAPRISRRATSPGWCRGYCSSERSLGPRRISSSCIAPSAPCSYLAGSATWRSSRRSRNPCCSPARSPAAWPS